MSHAELSFFAVSLNPCYCLKSSLITVDFWQEVQQNNGRKSNDLFYLSGEITLLEIGIQLHVFKYNIVKVMLNPWIKIQGYI